MKKIESVEKAILLEDIEGLREIIASICYVRRDFSTGEFDELVDYVINKGIELKDDKLVGQLISEGKTTFTEDDFPMAILELKENFCDERIEDVKKIGRALYGKKRASSEKPERIRDVSKSGVREDVKGKKDYRNLNESNKQWASKRGDNRLENFKKEKGEEGRCVWSNFMEKFFNKILDGKEKK